MMSGAPETDQRAYWNDFVSAGYVNDRTEAIFLAGLPAVPAALRGEQPTLPVASSQTRQSAEGEPDGRR